MRVIKHFWWVAKHKLNAFNCKHLSLDVASCPYTGLTYTTCNKCLSRMKVEKTVEQS
jgi:hypothetical protein